MDYLHPYGFEGSINIKYFITDEGNLKLYINDKEQIDMPVDYLPSMINDIKYIALEQQPDDLLRPFKFRSKANIVYKLTETALTISEWEQTNYIQIKLPVVIQFINELEKLYQAITDITDGKTPKLNYLSIYAFVGVTGNRYYISNGKLTIIDLLGNNFEISTDLVHLMLEECSTVLPQYLSNAVSLDLQPIGYIDKIGLSFELQPMGIAINTPNNDTIIIDPSLSIAFIMELKEITDIIPPSPT